MPSPFSLPRLTAALADRYAIEREIGSPKDPHPPVSRMPAHQSMALPLLIPESGSPPQV
jgi:hypothetical protein